MLRHQFIHLGLATGALLLAGASQAQDKGTDRHLDADQVVGALDLRRRQHGQGSSKAKGYKADLQYAEDDIPNQLAQIENMITKGAKVLVIAAIDGTTLSDALQKAADAGIKVIAYDRLITRLEERRLLRHLRQLPASACCRPTRSSTSSA